MTNVIEVKKVNLPFELGNDFEEANRILASGDVTDGYYAEDYYTERKDVPMLGTYQIKISRKDDYQLFMRMLSVERVNNNLTFPLGAVTFEAWKSGKVKEGGREFRLGKWLRKNGVSQYLLDFYSQQIKTEATYYISVLKEVQYITGMSYYSTMEWDGVSGSTCQDPRNEYDECRRLLASLHDNKLYVIFLHNSVDDLQDMTEKALARTMARLITVDGQQYMLGTRLYGNNETKNILKNGLEALNVYGIFGMNQIEKSLDKTAHVEEADGLVIETIYDSIYIEESGEEWTDVDCPLCGGRGDYEAYFPRLDNYVTIDCPNCGGTGTVEVSVYYDVREEVEIEEEIQLIPYGEDYRHHGNKIKIDISKNLFKRAYRFDLMKNGMLDIERFEAEQAERKNEEIA